MTPDPFTVLRGLWEGDRDSYGYQHAAIVVECCELSPRGLEITPQWVLQHLRLGYPKWQDIDEEEQQIILAGIKRWCERGMPRKTVHQPESASGR